MIFYDPTEARAGTRLPASIIQAGRALPGLEKYTAADLLVSPHKKPILTAITDSKPSQLSLRRHTEHGLLVQRKTGMDAIGSIPKLERILVRMQSWCQAVPPWLVLDGHYGSKDGLVVVGKRITKWKYSAFIGALDSWQMGGGCVTIIADSGALLAWLARWSDRIRVLPDRPLGKPILGSEPVIVTDSFPWVTTLATFPGIGPSLAVEIAHYTGSLKESLVLLSDPALLELKKKGRYPRGIGPIIIKNARRWLGMGMEESGSIETFATDWRREEEE